MRALGRFPYLFVHPAVLLVAAMGLHVAGRTAAFGSPHKVDSFIYAISAYKLWQPDAAIDALVPDKPIGQPLLTGWCFRLASGPPSRAALVPIESFFMISAYMVFWMLTRRLFGTRLACGLTLFLVLAHNTYNAVDSATDGFNLAENYMILPTVMAVGAYLTMRSSFRRGLSVGLCIGLALTIKQTASALLVAIVLDRVIQAIGRKRYRSVAAEILAICAGIVVAWAPLLTFLYQRGWLAHHLSDLADLSAKHLDLMPLKTPALDHIMPLAPIGWWILIGLLCWLVSRGGQRTGGDVTDTTSHSAKGLPAQATDVAPVRFLILWSLVELVLLWSLTIPALHYYQPITVPLTLLSGQAMSFFVDRLRGMAIRRRLATEQWILATTIALTFLAAMPMLAEASKRRHEINRRQEVRLFEEHLKAWSPEAIDRQWRDR